MLCVDTVVNVGTCRSVPSRRDGLGLDLLRSALSGLGVHGKRGCRVTIRRGAIDGSRTARFFVATFSRGRRCLCVGFALELPLGRRLTWRYLSRRLTTPQIVAMRVLARTTSSCLGMSSGLLRSINWDDGWRHDPSEAPSSDPVYGLQELRR